MVSRGCPNTTNEMMLTSVDVKMKPMQRHYARDFNHEYGRNRIG